MESLIGNNSNATCSYYDNNIDADNLYDTLFNEETDALDDDDLEFQELDENGQPISRPDVETLFLPMIHLQQKMMINISSWRSCCLKKNIKKAIVIPRKHIPNGNLKGTTSSNIILDTREYEVQFEDGIYVDYSENVLVENLYEYVDENGASHNIIKSITNHHQLENAVLLSEGTYTILYGTKQQVIITEGWDFYVEWINGSSFWIPLREIKESIPIYIAEYAKSHDKKSFSYLRMVGTIYSQEER